MDNKDKLQEEVASLAPPSIYASILRSMYQVFHTFITELILIEDFFLSFLWIHGIAHDRVLQASSHTSEWITTSKVIPKLAMKIPNCKRCALILKLTTYMKYTMLRSQTRYRQVISR
jgi:hypothetical protein